MNNIIKRVWNQNRMVNIEDLRGMAFQAEDGGHTFEISGINDSGSTVDLSGTVAGVFMRPDGTDVALTGESSGGVASVTLSDACYSVSGRFGLTIFVTDGEQKTCVYSCVGTIAQSTYGTVAGDTPQNVVDLINAINAAVQSIPADYTDLMADIAPTYSDSALYAKGAYAWYSGTLYRAKVNITTAESFDASHWISASIGSYMGDLTTEITNLDSAVFSTSGEELTNTVGGTEPTVPAGSWFELTNRLEPGDTYKIRLKLAGWSSTQISKITKVALYWSSSGSSLVDELSFAEELKADEWLSTDAITITGTKSVKYIKLSLAGSYSAATNSVHALTYRITDRETYVGRLRNEVEAAERTMTLHPAYYPTSRRYISANNVWGNQASKASIFIPVDQAVKLSVTGNATNESQIALLKSDNSATTGVAPDYVAGWTTPLTIPAGETVSVVIPSEARVIYVANDTSDTLLPSAIIKTIPVNRVSRKVPIFSFMDDDARAVALSWLEQVVDATRIPISIALITGVVGDTVQDEGLYSSWETIRRLKNKGFDFVNHTNTTVAITTMTLAEVEQSFKTAQQLMEAHGLPHSDILVLPGGNTDADRTALAQNYFRCMMSTTPKLNLPPINTWYLSRVSMEGFTLAEQKAFVDQAIEQNAWCIFYGHAYHEVYDQTKLEEFIELVNYIAAKGGQILSVSDAFERYRNNVTGDANYGCDSVIY